MIIVGQGRQTEPNYFRGLRQEEDVQQRWAVTVKKGAGKSPEEAVKQAIQEKKKKGNWLEGEDEAWCLLDVEGDQNRAALKQAIELAKEHDVTVCLSNPCFEVWLLAHFDKTRQLFLNASAVVKKLNEHWQRAFRQPYDKSADDIFQRLNRPESRLHEAVANAASAWQHHSGAAQPTSLIPPNSSTQVFELVRRLLGQSQDPS